jgi:sulfate transport system ATP-binding protein
MSFLGPVTTLDGKLIRPHDIEVSTHSRIAGAVGGRVVRMVRVGFEVRLTVAVDRPDHPEVLVTVTRAHQRNLGIDEGTRVWLTPTHGAPVVPVMEPASSTSEMAV